MIRGEAPLPEDYYEITLSIRPQGEFLGTPGQEQFFIQKEGMVAHRQVLALPRSKRGFPIIPAAIGLAVVVAAVVLGIIFLPPGEESTSDEPNVVDDSSTAPVPTVSASSATPLPATAVSTPSTTPDVTAFPTPGPAATLGVSGRYVNADDSSEFLEINPDGTFSWVLPGQGVNRSGVWTDDGSGIALDTREASQTKRIAGKEILNPGGGSWEKYGEAGDVPGTYLRLNFEQLGDYLELLPDGSFISEEGGVVSDGVWRESEGEVVLVLDSDIAIESKIEDGAIIDADGVKWVKQ